MMKRTLVPLVVTVLSVCVLGVAGIDAGAQTTEISKDETTPKVPELDDLHEVVYQLWHDAYPEKNYALIVELLPQADELTAKLDAAELPGILRDKQKQWDAGKVELKDSLAALHAAVEANDEKGMLEQTEAFHTSFEGLVRTIRPVVPALASFHEELYKLYHYYAPEYDLENIRTQAKAMQEKIPALKESKLPKKLEQRQADFDAAVAHLSSTVDHLVQACTTNDKKKILDSVEGVHTAYVKTEQIFD
jgi:hypothetical protein